MKTVAVFPKSWNQVLVPGSAVMALITGEELSQLPNHVPVSAAASC